MIYSAVRTVEQVDIKPALICEADFAKVAIEQYNFECPMSPETFQFSRRRFRGPPNCDQLSIARARTGLPATAEQSVDPAQTPTSR